MTLGTMRDICANAVPQSESGDSVEPGATLLIIDDQPLLAEYMASVAEDWGWTTVAACTADEVEAQFSAAHPEAVALDLDMPDRDGVEILRFLAANDYAGSVFIISACDQDVVETSARLGRQLGLNVTGFAQKPVTADDFAALLQRTEVQPKH